LGSIVQLSIAERGFDRSLAGPASTNEDFSTA